MNELFERFVVDPLAAHTLRELAVWALAQFYAFTLVLVRMSGLMTVGPIFGQALVPANVRILLTLAMSLLITPTLHSQMRLGFDRLDVDRNGRLTRDEVPESLADRVERQLARAGKPLDDGLAFDEYVAPMTVPSTVFEFAWIGVAEFALGLVLGLGVTILLSGLELAGRLFDDQTGIGLAQIIDPAFETEGSVTGQLLYLLGVAVFLLLEPLGGHLQMVSALVETFQTLPVGEAFVAASAVDYLRDLVHQSLVLGLQIAAPMLAVMSLVSLAMGFLGHTVPQVNVLVLGFAVRALVNVLILALCLSGAARAVADAVPAVIDQLRELLSHVP